MTRRTREQATEINFMSNLKTEQNHQAIELMVKRHAREQLGFVVTSFFEHGQWWVENPKTGAQWSVVDEAYSGGEFKQFGFEQVTPGDL